MLRVPQAPQILCDGFRYSASVTTGFSGEVRGISNPAQYAIATAEGAPHNASTPAMAAEPPLNMQPLMWPPVKSSDNITHQHGSTEFLKVLRAIDRSVPQDQRIHLVLAIIGSMQKAGIAMGDLSSEDCFKGIRSGDFVGLLPRFR